MIDYKDILRNMHKRLETLYDEREMADPLDRAKYTLRIDNLENDIRNTEKKSDVQANEEQNNKTTIYIIATGAKDVKKAMGENLFSLVDSYRYSLYCKECWRPFENGACINYMLSYFRDTYGYNYTIEKIALDIKEEILYKIDNDKKNSIAIIDIFSMCENNRSIISCFDSKEAGGVLLPQCNMLNDKLREYASENRAKFFKIHEYRLHKLLPSNYLFDINQVENFYMQLKSILRQCAGLINRLDEDIHGDLRLMKINIY